MISDGTIVNADINASAAIAQSKLNIADATTSASGYQSAADKTKLDGIEASATADQTDAEIRAAVEAATDSNVFTDADHTKLNGIEASADVTDAANVKAAIESFTNSVIVPDNIAFRFGNDSNLRIFHDANDDWSYITETDDEAEGLRIRGQNLVLEDNAGDNYVLCKHDAEVILYYDNSAKIETTSTGVGITGKIDISGAIDENVFAITDAASVAIDPDNGTVQTWTLGANRTATDSLTSGQSTLLMITAGSNTLTWPTITWAGGSAPTLSTSSTTAIELWKVGTTLYGANVGDV